MTDHDVYLVVSSVLEYNGADRIQFWLSSLSKLSDVSVIVVITHLDQAGNCDNVKKGIQNLQNQIVKNRFKVLSHHNFGTQPT